MLITICADMTHQLHI